MEGWGDWVHMPGHEAQAGFPLEAEGLKDYSVIILSDIGADTFLLHPRTWIGGERTPNRLRLIEEYVRGGGGLIMAGGYLSYQGIQRCSEIPGHAGRGGASRGDRPLRRPRRVPRGDSAEDRRRQAPDNEGTRSRHGRTSSATTGSGRRRGWRCSPLLATTRCSSSVSTAKAELSLGRATSVPTGARRSSPSGKATRSSGEG